MLEARVACVCTESARSYCRGPCGSVLVGAGSGGPAQIARSYRVGLLDNPDRELLQEVTVQEQYIYI